MRPDLRIETAFLDLVQAVVRHGRRPAGPAGYDEIVVVPLLLTEAYHAKVDVPAAVAEADAHATRACRSGPPRSSASRPRFLEVLDLRLREALKRRPGSASSTPSCWPPPAPRDPLANQAVARLARRLGRPPQAAGHRGVRLGALPRPPARPSAPSAPRAAPHRGRLAVPGARASCPTGPRSSPSRPAPSPCPSRSAPTRSGPHDPGPLRRRRGRARPGLTGVDRFASADRARSTQRRSQLAGRVGGHADQLAPSRSSWRDRVGGDAAVHGPAGGRCCRAALRKPNRVPTARSAARRRHALVPAQTPRRRPARRTPRRRRRAGRGRAAGRGRRARRPRGSPSSSQ